MTHQPAHHSVSQQLSLVSEIPGHDSCTEELSVLCRSAAGCVLCQGCIKLKTSELPERVKGC